MVQTRGEVITRTTLVMVAAVFTQRREQAWKLQRLMA